MQASNSSIYLFSHMVKGMNNESCMRQKTRVPAGWLLLPSLTVCVCVRVCVCMHFHSYCNFPLGFFLWSYYYTVYHTHIHTLPTGITAEKFHLSKNVLTLTFSWDGLQGPPHSEFFRSAEQSNTRAALVSVVCKITVMVNKDDQEPLDMVFTSQFFSFHTWRTS